MHAVAQRSKTQAAALIVALKALTVGKNEQSSDSGQRANIFKCFS